MPAVLSLPSRLATWLPNQPWLQVRSDIRPSLRLEDRELRLRLLEAPARLSVDQLPLLLDLHLSLAEPDAAVPVLTGAFLSQGVREALEERDASYIDARGHLHLIAPGICIHLGSTKRSATAAKSSGQMTLGVHGVRAVQVLLQGQESFSISQVAEQASVSVGQAHKVLTHLEELGLLRTTGRGPSKRRIILSRTELLDWLQQQASATRREPSLQVAVYARRPEELWLQSSAKLSRDGIPHALTGSAAASVFGVGPTNVAQSRIRISPDVPLAHAAKQLDAEITERGANLTLLRDTGKVGSWAPTNKEGISIAPMARIYLDARSERRGEDIAQQFREVILGY
ncbi:hypothetical protein [Corallococcus sp. AS-1-6]|uniref:hypothetical protein n=1 Tax=Corallococcus sp. AS-1-6 TaxID=2874599 RepID=UPI001CBBA3E2|nr:hypothetical protein [Corallococcus sp. AS-1-6]MBZ4374527.1 hypothetical protein [Corallococcus sp. AS-1-6]